MNLERTDRTNWSTLKYIGKSPKLYLHRLTVPRKDTDALKLGRVTHTAIYEPELFKGRYAVMPRFHGGCNDDTAIEKGYEGGKQAKLAWEATHADHEQVTTDDYTAAWGMAEALHADPIAAPLVTGGTVEKGIEWTDAETGVECRGRVDRTGAGLSDLKTTQSIHGFMRDIARYQYHGQMAFYYDGLVANGVPQTDRPCIVAVEKAAPYDVLVVEFSDEDLAAGRELYRSYLRRLVECRTTGLWPGVSGGERVPLVLPDWARPRVELTMGGVAI